MKRWGLLLLGIAASTVSIVWLIQSADLASVGRAIHQASAAAWGWAAAIYLLGFLPRALRWRLMLSPVGKFRFTDLWRCIVMGYAGNNVLPFRLGELVRAIMFKQLTGFSRTTGLSSIMAERLLDGITLVFIFGTVLAGSASIGLTGAGLQPVFIGAALLAAGGLGLLLFSWFFIDHVITRANRLSERAGKLVSKFAEAIAFGRQSRILLPVLALSLLVWTLEGSMFVILAYSMELPEPLSVGFMSLAVINLGILIPAAPGYVGIFQAATVLAFSVLGLPQEAGLAFGILSHSAQFLPLTTLGLFLVIPHWRKLGVGLRRSPSPSHV